MHPFIVRFEHPLTGEPSGVTTYAALMFVGAAFAITSMVVLGRRRGIAAFDMFAAGAIAFGAGLVGARMAFIAVHGKEIVEAGGVMALFSPGGGLIWYGGAIAGAIGFIAYARGYRLPVATMLDAGVPGAALGQAFGRLGCFTAGCCHGSPAPPSLPSVVFSGGSLAPADIPLHPVQLYEAGLLLVLALVLAAMVWRKRSRLPTGTTAITYLGGYALLRFFTETMRGDPRGPILGSLSLSQTVSILVLVAASAWLVVLMRGMRNRVR